MYKCLFMLWCIVKKYYIFLFTIKLNKYVGIQNLNIKKNNSSWF